MTETREALEARKRELFDAIRTLQRDHQDGQIEEGSYVAARERYEREAAHVESRLDDLTDSAVGPPTVHRPVERWSLWLVAPTTALVTAAITLFLVSALGHRSSNAAITGNVPTVRPVANATLTAAEEEARAHPANVNAQIAAGTAYLDIGENGKADAAFRRAIRLDPGRPEAPTYEAMLHAGEGKSQRALLELGSVERRHPTYARAWLLDGLISSKNSKGKARAIASWKRFLALQPHSAVSADVRAWLRALEK